MPTNDKVKIKLVSNLVDNIGIKTDDPSHNFDVSGSLGTKDLFV